MKIVRIVTVIHLPIVTTFLHAAHSKHSIRNRPSRFFVVIAPFHTFPQPWHFVWRMSESRIWFWIIVYPSMGKFSPDLVCFGTLSTFWFFSIFSFDGNDGRVEAAVVVAARASIFDITELDDFAGNCLWRVTVLFKNCRVHLMRQTFYWHSSITLYHLPLYILFVCHLFSIFTYTWNNRINQNM